MASEKGKFRKASLTTNLFGGALHYTKEHEWTTWCCGFLYFEEDIGIDTVRDMASQRLLEMPRFRSRYDYEKAGFEELSEDEIDLDYHVVEVKETMSVEDARQEYVGDVYKHFDFDPNKPLWQLNYFPKLEDGRALLLTKFTHVIGDGISQIEILYKLLDKQEADTQEYSAKRSSKVKPKKKRFGPLNRAGIVLSAGPGVLKNVLGGPDSFNPYSRANSDKAGKMKIAFGESVPLEKIKDIKAKFEGATVNDIIFGAMNLAINESIIEVEEQTGKNYRNSSSKIRFGVAINTRKAGEDVFRDGDPHNSVASGLMKVRLDYKDRIDCVFKMKRQLDVLKLSPLPFVQQALGNVLMSNLSREGSTKKFLNFYATSTAVVSNVPGPKKAVFLSGNKVVGFEFLLSSPKGCYIGLLSYNGTVTCCISLDESTIIEPEQFTKYWKQEFDGLYNDVMAYDGEIKTPSTFLEKL